MQGDKKWKLLRLSFRLYVCRIFLHIIPLVDCNSIVVPMQFYLNCKKSTELRK
jgi:hypothetical protein